MEHVRQLSWFQRFIIMAGLMCLIAAVASAVVSIAVPERSFATNLVISIPTAIVIGFFQAFALDRSLRGLLQRRKRE